ncbi:hypothetical protein AX16_006438 [Volvariella volvacea WC 439]|nr:hypothetical protein AX16_006438 [Volvariella volvacea WC 439]
MTGQDQPALPLASSSNGRRSGKSWKASRSASVRSQQSSGLKTKWHDRMERTKKEQAVRKLQAELKEEKQAEIQRRLEITKERKRAAEERRRLEEEKAKMGAKKAARMRRRLGRTKKING